MLLSLCPRCVGTEQGRARGVVPCSLPRVVPAIGPACHPPPFVLCPPLPSRCLPQSLNGAPASQTLPTELTLITRGATECGHRHPSYSSQVDVVPAHALEPLAPRRTRRSPNPEPPDARPAVPAAATCATIDIPNSNRDGGTHTSTTGGTVSVTWSVAALHARLCRASPPSRLPAAAARGRGIIRAAHGMAVVRWI